MADVVLELPTSPGFIVRRWGLVANTQVHESPLTKSVQRLRLTGERWMGEWTLPPVKDRAVVAQWEAFFVSLEGQYGTFWAGPPFRNLPRGSVGGTPLVNGANQTGSQLVLDGLPVSTTDVFKQGDYVRINGTNQLVMVVADVTSDGSGNATLPIYPRLRDSPGDNATITTVDPVVQMMLVTDEVAWDVDKFGKFDFTFSAVEVYS